MHADLFQHIRSLTKTEIRRLIIAGYFNNHRVFARFSTLQDVGIFYQYNIISSTHYEGIYVKRGQLKITYDLVRVSEAWLKSCKLRFSEQEGVWK
jgi:hypothetical protein